jgi:methylase of polypeptide subunit release factors
MIALKMAKSFHPGGLPSAPSQVTAAADDIAAADQALLELGKALKERGYRFTTVTPASHQRVNARLQGKAPSLEDVFGWSRPFRRGDLAEHIVTRLSEAGALEPAGPLLRSNVRYSTLGEQIFVHSAFPTETSDAVFFGPDTYRFARMVRQSLATLPASRVRRVIDVGAGSGAGGLHAAALLAAHAPTLVLTDINACALRYSRINAALNGVPNVHTIESDLFDAVDGAFDLIMSNPPYLVDPLARLYRHGGGELGFELSLKIVDQGIDRLAPGGRLVLYTGSAIVDGVDAFHGAIAKMLAARGVRWAYEEIDPDVFGEELEHPPYDRADRIAVVGVTVDAA